MLIRDIILTPEDTPENYFIRKRLKGRVEESCSVFINNCIGMHSNLTRELYNFRKKLSQYNEEYREHVLGLNPKAKVPAITVGTFVVSIKQLIHMQFNKSVSQCSKLVYDKETFIVCILDELSLVYAKYGKIYDFQFSAVVCYIISDYFDIDSVPFDDVRKITEDVLNTDMSAIEGIISRFGIACAETEKPRKDNGFPDKETIETWLAAGYKRSFIKKTLASQMGCSEKTVQRLLASYNLTATKYTTKRNDTKPL